MSACQLFAQTLRITNNDKENAYYANTATLFFYFKHKYSTNNLISIYKSFERLISGSEQNRIQTLGPRYND